MNKLFIYTFVLIYLLGSCAPEPKTLSIQHALLSNICKNACWMGIQPGISTTDDVINILVNNYGSENIIKEENGGSWITIHWNSSNDDWGSSGKVYVEASIVDSISVIFSEKDIMVEDVINQLGYPEMIGLELDNGLKIEPDSKCVRISMLYPNLGIRFSLLQYNDSVGIHEKQSINEIFIRSPWADNFYPWAYMLVRKGWDGYHEYCPNAWPEEK